jgi:hypothetical protein
MPPLLLFRAVALGLMILLVSGAAALAEPPAEEAPTHMWGSWKGFELYSWIDENGHCAYAFLPGTNRLKLIEEIEGSRISRAEVVKEFERLVTGDSVLWANEIAGADRQPSLSFAYPPLSVVEELRKQVERKEAKLLLPQPMVGRTCLE